MKRASLPVNAARVNGESKWGEGKKRSNLHKSWQWLNWYLHKESTGESFFVEAHRNPVIEVLKHFLANKLLLRDRLSGRRPTVTWSVGQLVKLAIPPPLPMTISPNTTVNNVFNNQEHCFKYWRSRFIQLFPFAKPIEFNWNLGQKR